MKRIPLVIASVGALVIGLSGPVAAAEPPPAYTCTGGDFSTGDFVHIGSGNWASVTIAGACIVDPGSTINIVGNLTVAPGAVFDAQTFPSTITVGHNVTAGAGALLGLGCQPDFEHKTGHECGAMFDPDDAGDVPGDSDYPCDPETENPFGCSSSVITVDGNLTATGANTVLLNGVTVKGNVTLAGGGGYIPWSVKNNTIGRNLTVSEVTADWFGALFNTVGGNMTLVNITATDPEDTTPPVYVVRNTIGRNLTCMGLGPALSFGFYPGQANTVGHRATGQCANPVST
jgi:acetyltransferase-like isoleucine patch superfamily enzyme